MTREYECEVWIKIGGAPMRIAEGRMQLDAGECIHRASAEFVKKLPHNLEGREVLVIHRETEPQPEFW